MFGIFTSRPKDYRIATLNTNVDALVTNLNTQKTYYDINVNKSDLLSLSNYGLSNQTIQDKIEPIFYSQVGLFKDFILYVVSDVAKVEVIVGIGKNNGNGSIKLQFYRVTTTGSIIQQYDQIARYKWRGGWLGKVVTGSKKFSHYENVPRGLNGEELELIRKKIFALNENGIEEVIASLK